MIPPCALLLMACPKNRNRKKETVISLAAVTRQGEQLFVGGKKTLGDSDAKRHFPTTSKDAKVATKDISVGHAGGHFAEMPKDIPPARSAGIVIFHVRTYRDKKKFSSP